MVGLVGIGELGNTNAHAYDSDLAIPKDPNGTEFNYNEDVNADNYVRNEFDREYHLGNYRHHSQRYWNNYYNKLDRNYNNYKEAELNKKIAKDKADMEYWNKQDRRNHEWYKSHTYRNKSYIHYVRYGNYSFSRHKYRYAFPSDDGDSNKLGLTKEWNNLISSIKQNRRYRTNATVRPGQLVRFKLIKRVNSNCNIYRAKFHGKSYYYADYHDHYRSMASPLTAIYSQGSFNSTYRPQQCKIIYLNYHHKIHNGSEWDTSVGDNSEEYKLHHGKWHESNTSLDVPNWLY